MLPLHSTNIFHHFFFFFCLQSVWTSTCSLRGKRKLITVRGVIKTLVKGHFISACIFMWFTIIQPGKSGRPQPARQLGRETTGLMLSTTWDVICQIDFVLFNSSSATYTPLSCLCTKQAPVLSLPNKQTSPQNKHKGPRQQSAFISALLLLLPLHVAHCHLTDDITTHLCHPVSYTVHAAMLQEWIEKEEKRRKTKPVGFTVRKFPHLTVVTRDKHCTIVEFTPSLMPEDKMTNQKWKLVICCQP